MPSSVSQQDHQSPFVNNVTVLMQDVGKRKVFLDLIFNQVKVQVFVSNLGENKTWQIKKKNNKKNNNSFHLATFGITCT